MNWGLVLFFTIILLFSMLVVLTIMAYEKIQNQELLEPAGQSETRGNE